MLSYGWVSPFAFFIPGIFIIMAQGIAMPYAQVGAIAEVPRFAGTAAGIGVFMQNFCAAVFSQLYGLLADGSPKGLTVGHVVRLAGCCWVSYVVRPSLGYGLEQTLGFAQLISA